MINPVYEAIFNYADRVGASNIKKSPNAWSRSVNAEWVIAINPHSYVTCISIIGGDGSFSLYPMHCAIWRSGKIQADVSPFDCFHVDPAFDRAEFIGVISHA